MTYARYLPSPPLNAYINYLYYLDGHLPYLREMILPFPGLDLKINLGGALQVYTPDQAEPPAVYTESWLVGLWSVRHMVNWPVDLRLFGVNFKPSGAYPFVRLPLSEVNNQVVPLDALWGFFATEIRERLYAAPTIQAGFALFEQLLLARLREASFGLDLVQYAISELFRHHGALSIRALSDGIGVSQNHLGTLFKRTVGVPAKELARLYRFEHVLRSVNSTRPVNWTRIAHESHYYDQSHFNNEFAALTGHSPTGYLRLRRQIYAENPVHYQLIRDLPID
jgi:AraC-like DNA-binding protein